MNLIRVTKGKNIIITSCAQETISIRNPYDIMNLCSLMNLTQAQAKAALSSNPQTAILHGKIRRTAQVSNTDFGCFNSRIGIQGVCFAEDITECSLSKDIQWIMTDI
jgi:RNase P/RNase MRP subunit p30